MNALLQYLDKTGWRDFNESPGYPASRLREIGEWHYHWLVHSPIMVHLVRIPFRGGPPARFRFPITPEDIEAFVLRDEDSCLRWARNLEEGIHPDSPPPNDRGHKTGF